MLRMQPVSLMAEGQNAEQKQRYRVCFHGEGGEVQYTFTVDTTNEHDVKCEDEFLKAIYGDPAAASLIRSISMFHHAGETMMRAGEPVAGLLPGGVPTVHVRKQMKPTSLCVGEQEGEDIAAYRVRCAQSDGEVEYTFSVDESTIVECVSWEHDFWLDMGADIEPANALLQSVGLFHAARRVGIKT